ncbi:MAG: hypothetical protein K2G23_07430 [Muribaculaceae bacterium]|nr:hypothetical protein [Muribaculaceae bacterium]
MEKTQFSNNIWRYNKKFMLGFTTGKLDRKNRFGGEISSRWGASLVGGRNIHFHRNPIAGFLKIGMNLDFEANYMNFEKGSGSFSDIINPDNYDDYENIPTLGEHYLTIGVAVGPTATFAPFYAFSNADLAALRFRPYFRITPSFASYIVSDEDDIEMHNAFALWYSAGLEIQWKRLIVGLGWKGSSAKYKGLVDDFLNEESSSESYKFDVNMFNILIGVAF